MMMGTDGIMTKVGIMLDDGFHDLELWIPYYRFREEGIKFDILAWEDREYKGVFGIDSIRPDKLLGLTALSEYDLIYMPGARSPENLLKHPETVELVKNAAFNNVSFATICHSPLVLAEAGLLKDKEVTGHPSIKSDMEKAGAVFVDKPFIFTSTSIFSGKTHFQMDQIMPELLRLIKK